MGEGRRDRSSRRHRVNLGIEKSSSDTEVARSNAKRRKNRSKKKEKWPFLEGLTVDELGRYRRRRVENHPKDTLGAYCQSSDASAALVTEYRRAFRAISEDSIVNLLESPSKRPPDSVATEVIEPLVTRITETQSTVQKSPTVDPDPAMETALDGAQHHEGIASGRRPALFRRGTSLRREGDEFYGNTEYSCYVSHEGNHRAELARRPTSLKMEGNMADTTSEQCEKFIEWLNVTRPELARVPTNLKLEGDIETTTENHDKYVPFVGARRPELLRQTAHLKLEDKRTPVVPECHFKAGGDFYDKTENTNFYGDPRNYEGVGEGQEGEDRAAKETEGRKEQDMKMLVSKLEDLKGPAPLQLPEYKDAYRVFPRERPKLMKPEDEIGRADGSKVHSSGSHGKFQTKIDHDLEYRSKYIDRDRALYGKPPLSLRRPSMATPSGLNGRTSRESRGHGAPISEVRSQYVPYGQVPRVETLKMPANLRLEGSIDLHPEYRDAYCARKESAMMLNEPRAHRRRDRSLSASRRRDVNCGWVSNNNGEQFGQINAANEQDSFQLLSTKVHEDSVVGKPPPGSRRAAHLETGSPSAGASMRHRSPSPSYRLQVQNVDDEEPRGFARRRRRSPSFHLGDRSLSPPTAGLPDHGQRRRDTTERAYSPSFGASQRRNHEEDEHAFVVLDNARSHNAPYSSTVAGGRSRKFNDRNCNNSIAAKGSRGRPRNRTPTNWMPPWYDNTNTI